MAGCCGGSGATCACKLVEGYGITITGSGSVQDPFQISADTVLVEGDNTTFNVSITGSGTVASPWTLSVTYAATAKLDDIPDVNAPSPTNGQVLGWDTATSKWTARAPTTAASGSVLHDTSLAGDGSAGSPLAVVTNPLRYIESTATAGVGLTDAGVNSLNRRFIDATDRTNNATPPTLAVNALSSLASKPGELDYWDGASWQPLQDTFDAAVLGPELLQMSGPYTGSRMLHFMKMVSGTTDGTGLFDILSTADLSGRAGVLVCFYMEASGANLWAVLVPQVSSIQGRMLTAAGAVAASTAFSGVVEAWLY